MQVWLATSNTRVPPSASMTASSCCVLYAFWSLTLVVGTAEVGDPINVRVLALGIATGSLKSNVS